MNGRSKYFDRNDRKSLYGNLKKKDKICKGKDVKFPEYRCKSGSAKLAVKSRTKS